MVIDVQNDFCPGGALAVSQGDAIVRPINGLMAEFAVRVLTQDWHPADHSSFAANHPGAEAFSMIEMPYGPQVLWPVHCVQGTDGAAFHRDLATGGPDHPQGLSVRYRQLFGILRKRSQDADRARRVSAQPLGYGSDPGRARHRFLCCLFRHRRDPARLFGYRSRRDVPRH
jgi:hypothetical protein